VVAARAEQTQLMNGSGLTCNAQHLRLELRDYCARRKRRGLKLPGAR
jgi:hypothetical protein